MVQCDILYDMRYDMVLYGYDMIWYMILSDVVLFDMIIIDII